MAMENARSALDPEQFMEYRIKGATAPAHRLDKGNVVL
jgi:hypothetical protein